MVLIGSPGQAPPHTTRPTNRFSEGGEMAEKRLATYTTINGTTYEPGTAASEIPDEDLENVGDHVWGTPVDEQDDDPDADKGPKLAPDAINEVKDGEFSGDSEYAEYTVPELLDEARSRGLEGLSSAKKAELIQALEADDASKSG